MTHPLAAASAISGMSGWLLLAALTLATIYAISCAIWPFRPCPKCNGLGRHHAPRGRAWRPCRRCRGSGARVRYGRRAWTYLKRNYLDTR